MSTRTRAGVSVQILGVILTFTGAIGIASPGAAAAVDASVPNTNVITGCYNKQTGLLRITHNAPCTPSEQFISWNIQGPRGLQGFPGLPGARGPHGPPGAAGLELINFSSHNDSNSPKNAFAMCPSGKHVVGGGAQVFIGAREVTEGPIAIKKSKPSMTMDGWAATAEEIVPTDLKWFVTAYAICATVAQ